MISMKLSPEQMAAKLAARTRVDPNTGCHIWQGAIVHGGYGQICTGGKGNKARAHRVAYELAKGPIPDGLVIDHLCRTRACCNPDHLEAVTHQINALRGEGVAAVCAAKTHCPQGHPYDQANTYVAKNGHRGCRACWALKWAKAKDKANARRKAMRAASAEPISSTTPDTKGPESEP